MSASARPRWRCARPSSRRWRACRWRSWCRRRCWRASISRRSRSASPGCRSRSGRRRGWSARRSSRRPRRASPTARSTSSSARMRCSAASISFKNLGLLIVDEEQHFGVKHKERLKELKSDVHVLTLSATPIPRTLQLALTGVRELSLIATPPVDRMAVRTFISPFDPLVIRETLLRERYRGGHSFYVVPRIADLAGDPGFPAQPGAGTEGRRRPRPDAARRARRHHERLLRRPVRRAAVDVDRRIRARHPDRQHDDRAPRRHVRPGAALPAARPRRPLQGARLCAVHAAGQPQADRHRRAPPEGAAVAGHARRRLPAGQPRSRHPRRRQSARRGAVRPHQGGRLRALPADAGGGGRRDHAARGEVSRRPAGRRRSRSARR